MVTNNSKALKSIASGIADMEPEAGWHPSHPVVERSWDAIFDK